MGELRRIKRYSEIYNLLSDANEYKLLDILEKKLKKEGYKICVVGKKYKFKYHTAKCKVRKR